MKRKVAERSMIYWHCGSTLHMRGTFLSLLLFEAGAVVHDPHHFLATFQEHFNAKRSNS
jgi:hypothetical protein